MRRKLAKRLGRVDHRGPLASVLLRQQTVHRHDREVRVAIVGLTVGERQVYRLAYGVDVSRRVVPHLPEVEVFQDVERLHQHSALRPRSLPVDLVTHVRGLERRLVLGFIGRQGLQAQNAAHAVRAVVNYLRHLTGVEAVSRGANAVRPVPGGRAFGLHQLSQNRSQALLHQK